MITSCNTVTALHNFVGYEGFGHDLAEGRRELHYVAESERVKDAAKPRDFKVVVVGEAGVGKTSMLARACNNTFDPNYKITIGVDFMFKKYKVLDTPVQLTMWDTAGQEKYHALSRSYFKSADAVIIVYDVHETSSYEKIVDRWLPTLQDVMDPKDPPLMVLVGNKVDLPHFVNDATAASLAQARRMEHYLASVKDNSLQGPPSSGARVPVARLFDRLACLLLERALLRESGDAADRANNASPAQRPEKVTLASRSSSPNDSGGKKSNRPGCCK